MALFDPSPGTPACAPPGIASSSIRSSAAKWAPIYSARQVPQCVGSAPIVSPFRPNGVTIRSQGTKAPVKTLEAQDRRSPLTTWRMSRIAKGSYCRARCSQKQALAQIAKSGGLRFHSELPAVLASGRTAGGGRQCWRFITRTRLLMRNRIDIDPKHSRAIVQQIGERLAAFMKEEPELPASLRAQIDRLRELEEQSPSIIPSAER